MSGLTMRIAASAVVVAAAVVGAAPATAAEWGINGTWATSSNGDLAKINYRLEPQPSVRSNWTISTQCTSPFECVGTVQSDAGWTAPIYTTNGFWYVKRLIKNWRYCPDGSPIDGMQMYKLYPVGPGGYHVADDSDEWTGQDKTMGPSGACGRNAETVIEIPFYMKKI